MFKTIMQITMVSLLAIGTTQALEPGHPTRKYEDQNQHCYEVGKFFGEVVIQKQNGVSANTILAQAKGDMVMPAVELIYGTQKDVPPQLAAWYGYGYCMAFMAGEMKEKL